MHNFDTRRRRRRGDGLGIVAKAAWVIVGIALVVVTALVIYAKVNEGRQNVDIDIHNSPSPELPTGTASDPNGTPGTTAPVPTGVTSTDPPINTAAATPDPTPTATPGDTVIPGYTPEPEPDYSVFDNSVFVGNSIFEGLYRYGVITHGTFFTKVGLNILSVYSQPATNGTLPIINMSEPCELDSGDYEIAILMFGQNELGWPSLTSFISHYSQFIDDVRAKQPNAVVFLTGLPPFSKAQSDKGGETGANNDRIRMYNEQIEQLALTKNCYYIRVPDVMLTADGDLPDEASSDGMHLNMKYSKAWADFICLTVMQAVRGNQQ